MNRETLSILLRLVDRRALAITSALAILGAAMEGVGFVLLVPLLAILLTQGADTGALSPVASLLDALDWQPSLAGLLAIFVALVTIRSLADYLRSVIAARMSMSIVDTLRQRAFDALVNAEWKVLARMRQSESRAVLLTEIDRAGLAIDQFAAWARIAIGLGIALLAALAIAPLAALVGVALGSAVFALYRGLRRKARDNGEALGRHWRRIHGLLEENLNAIRSIKSFGKESETRGQLSAALAELQAVRLRYVADTARARAFLLAGAAAMAALLIWLSLTVWAIPAIAILPLVALFARALPLMGALLETSHLWAHSAPAIAAVDRLIGEAEAAAEKPAATPAPSPALASQLTLKGVSYSHRDGVAAVRGIDLAIAAGEMVALVGPSGSGKSTIADLAAGLIAPDQGEIAIDGQVLRNASRRAWRQRVAYVDQAPSLFDGSVRDNLAWAAPDAVEADMRRVLERASAHFVFDLPGALDCPLGEGGRQLSGGERQRIVLARALLREPALLILDEATSALDAASEGAVAEAIAALRGSRTILVIGHRGSLTDLAPRRITIAAGRIAHDENGGGA